MASSFADGLDERISQLRRRDRRYARNSYYFMLDALDFTIETLGRDRESGENRHVGGKEMLDGLRELAADQFGPMATVVLERSYSPGWGESRCETVTGTPSPDSARATRSSFSGLTCACSRQTATDRTPRRSSFAASVRSSSRPRAAPPRAP